MGCSHSKGDRNHKGGQFPYEDAEYLCSDYTHSESYSTVYVNCGEIGSSSSAGADSVTAPEHILFEPSLVSSATMDYSTPYASRRMNTPRVQILHATEVCQPTRADNVISSHLVVQNSEVREQKRSGASSPVKSFGKGSSEVRQSVATSQTPLPFNDVHRGRQFPVSPLPVLRAIEIHKTQRFPSQTARSVPRDATEAERSSKLGMDTQARHMSSPRTSSNKKSGSSYQAHRNGATQQSSEALSSSLLTRRSMPSLHLDGSVCSNSNSEHSLLLWSEAQAPPRSKTHVQTTSTAVSSDVPDWRMENAHTAKRSIPREGSETNWTQLPTPMTVPMKSASVTGHPAAFPSFPSPEALRDFDDAQGTLVHHQTTTESAQRHAMDNSGRAVLRHIRSVLQMRNASSG